MNTSLFSYTKDNYTSLKESFIDRLFSRSYVFVYFFLLQLLVNYLYKGFIEDPRMQEPLYRVAFLPLFWSLVLWLFLSSIKSLRVYKYTLGICSMIGAILFFFEMFLLKAYQSIYSYTVAYAILGTNPSEAQEFWTTTVSPTLFIPAILWFLGICTISYVSHLLVRPLRLNSKLTLSLIAIPLLVGLGYFYPRMLYIFFNTFDGGIASATLTPIERLAWSSGSVLYDAHKTEENLKSLNQSSVKIISKKPLDPHTVVLVLGESLRSDYMHCYGYPLENTPRLDSLVAQGNLALFTDAVSCTQSTGGSISEMMAFRTIDTQQEYHKAMLLPIVMKAGGYHTYWLSRQEKYSAYVRTISAIAHLSDSTTYITKGKDAALLPHLRSNNTEAPYLFEVLHLYGSHPAYLERYTPEFAKFTTKDLPKSFGDETKDNTVMHYVNSVYYADYVASSIIKHYKDKEAIVIYVSDHGQAMYDDPQNPGFAGHALSRGGISVPLMVYISPKMAEKYPDLKDQIFAARGNRIMTDVLPYAIVGLLGIDFDGYKADLDFFSPKYNNNRKRVAHMGEKRFYVDESQN